MRPFHFSDLMKRDKKTEIKSRVNEEEVEEEEEVDIQRNYQCIFTGQRPERLEIETELYYAAC